jgi:hypothetical protein
MSVTRVRPSEQVHLQWTHVYDECLIIHDEASNEDKEDDEDEDEDVDEDEDKKVTVSDKVDEDEHDDDDDNHNKSSLQNCQHCDNYVSHFRPENGIPGSFHKAELDLHRWIHEHPFEDSLGLEELTAELSAKSSEAERLRTQLNLTQTSLDAKHQQIIALLGENHRLKSSCQEEDLQRDRLRKDLKDQTKRRVVLSNRIDEVKARHAVCHQALVDTRLKLENTRHELENTRRELENARQDLAPPRHIEDASISSAVAMSPGPSQK